MWIARDKDNSLSLFSIKPYLEKSLGIYVYDGDGLS